MDLSHEVLKMETAQQPEGVWAVPDDLWDGTDSDQIVDTLIERGFITTGPNGNLIYGEALRECYPEVYDLLTAIQKAEVSQLISDMIDAGYLEMVFNEKDQDWEYVLTEEGKHARAIELG